MSELELVRAELEHTVWLAAEMARADVDELSAMGFDPYGGLQHALRRSEVACTALDRGRVAAMFGVVPVFSGETLLGRRRSNHLWFLTGTAFARRPLAATRTARRVVAALLERYGELENVIDCRHSQALRFAQLLGAEFGSPVRIPPLGAPFVPFRLGA